MIQPALPPSALPAALPIDILLPGGGSGAEAPDFAALLASTATGSSQPSAAPALPAALPQAEIAETATAIALPESGKILPSELRQIAGTAQPAAEATVAPEEPQPETASLSLPPTAAKPAHTNLAAKFQTASVRGSVHRPAKAESAEATEPAAETPEEPEALAIGVDPEPASPKIAPHPESPLSEAKIEHRAAPIAAVPTETQRSDRDAAASAEETSRSAPAARPVPARPAPAERALAQAAPQAAFNRVAEPNPTEPKGAASTSDPTPRAPAQLRVEIAPAPAAMLPEAAPAAPRRSAGAEARAAKLVPAADTPRAEAPVHFAEAFTAPAVPLHVSAAASPVALAAARPHDFAALVDRLVAAREAVMPHAATLTVSHAEFGPVELRFRHEERGIAVSLASADPDFVRAAAAAPQPVMPAAASAAPQGETSQSPAQRDASASTAGSSSGQPRGQQGERRGDQFTQSNQPQRGSARPGGERRSGIFA